MRSMKRFNNTVVIIQLVVFVRNSSPTIHYPFFFFLSENWTPKTTFGVREADFKIVKYTFENAKIGF